MNPDIQDYAFQDLPRKKIKKYARQYDGVNLVELMGLGDGDRPFLLKNAEGEWVMIWNPYNGVMAALDEDSVRAYATARYLEANDYPVFRSLDEANAWAREHDWPRKGPRWEADD